MYKIILPLIKCLLVFVSFLLTFFKVEIMIDLTLFTYLSHKMQHL